jgi:hypothetical protein
MSPSRVAALAFLLSGATSTATVAVEIPPDRFYPLEAVLVPLSDRANLQTRLDTYGAIRLERGDYATGNTLTKIVLQDGDRIYGLNNNVPEIEVEPGTTGAVVSGVHCRLTFPPSTVVTEQNLFRHITYSTISVNGGTIEENLFLNTGFSRWNVDHSAGGSWRNNRIVRFQNHTATPMLTLKGSSTSRPDSHGNVFLWMNSLGAYSEICNISNQRDVSIVFADFESYSNSGGNALTVADVDSLSIFGTYGSMRTGRTLDNGATSMWLHGHQMGTYVSPSVVQPAGNLRSVITNFSQDMATPQNSGAGDRLRMFSDASSASKIQLLNESTLVPPLGATPGTALLQAVATARSGTPWERPQFNPIPDPAGASWNVDLDNKPSSRALIQSEIDSRGVALLAAGTYYLDGPLVLGKGEGLVGAGMGNTVLIAKNRDIDLIVGDSAGGAISLMLADLTLQGGRSGIHHATSNGQFTDMSISHVTIRDMADCGIWMENIYAWDNNFIDFVNITNCPVGIKQRAPPGNGTGPVITYLDKNVFYQCQFVACGKALDLISVRASNGNAWINCLFKDNTQYVSAMRSHYTATFANCDFINNAGHPVLNVQGQLYAVSCRFDDTDSGARDFVDGISINLEGCTFAKQGSSSVVITSDEPAWIDRTNPANNLTYLNHNSFFFNCRSTNVDLNLMMAGVVVNSSFPDRSDLSIRAAVVTNAGSSNSGGTVTQLVSGAASAVGPQLLVGAVLPPGLTSEVPDSAPVITSPASASGTTGSPFAYLITASHFPSSFIATGLPSWLSLNASSGLISGIAPAGTTSVPISVSASNFLGASAAQAVALTFSAPVPGAPVISSSATAVGFLGQSFSYPIVASGSPTSYTAGPLPAGLGVDTTTGLISGVPTALGTTFGTISATNGLGTSAIPLTITIQTPPPSSIAPVQGQASSDGSGGCGFGSGAVALALLLAFFISAMRPRQ